MKNRKVSFSRELRWFSREREPEIEKWFHLKGSTFGKQKERFDYYLDMYPLENVSYKIREGRSEIKQQLALKSSSFHKRNFHGKVENWVKWSLDLKNSPSEPNKIFAGIKKEFIKTKKKRLLVIFEVKPNGDIINTKNDNYPAEGCQVEYTKLWLKQEVWYSFAFEAFGTPLNLKRNLERVSKYVVDLLPRTKCINKNSYSYARFLKMRS